MFEDFKRILGIPDTYNKHKIVNRILEKAKKDLKENCDIYFEYSLDLNSKESKINRIDFSIKENTKVKEKEVLLLENRS